MSEREFVESLRMHAASLEANRNGWPPVLSPLPPRQETETWGATECDARPTQDVVPPHSLRQPGAPTPIPLKGPPSSKTIPRRKQDLTPRGAPLSYRKRVVWPGRGDPPGDEIFLE